MARSISLVTLVAVAATVLPAGSALAASAPDVRADFDGDGFEDLAVGVPIEGIGSIQAAGAASGRS
jgi:hypothetical protein